MKEFLIDKEPLEVAVKTLQPFMSTEDTRYYLCGIYFEWKAGDEKLNMVATDGHKLCVLQVAIDPLADSQGDITAIVPASALKTILQILKSVGNQKMPVTIRFDENNRRMWIDALDQKGEFKLIDGTFPDYRRVIPTAEPTFTIALAKAQAKEAVKAVSSHKKSDPMVWHMTDANSPLKLVGEDKIVVVMPMHVHIEEMDLGRSEAA